MLNGLKIQNMVLDVVQEAEKQGLTPHSTALLSLFPAAAPGSIPTPTPGGDKAGVLCSQLPPQGVAQDFRKEGLKAWASSGNAGRSHPCQWRLVGPVWLAAALRLLGGTVPGRREIHSGLPQLWLCYGRNSHLGRETEFPGP